MPENSTPAKVRTYAMRTLPVKLHDRARLLAARRPRGTTVESIIVEALRVGLPIIEKRAASESDDR